MVAQLVKVEGIENLRFAYEDDSHRNGVVHPNSLSPTIITLPLSPSRHYTFPMDTVYLAFAMSLDSREICRKACRNASRNAIVLFEKSKNTHAFQYASQQNFVKRVVCLDQYGLEDILFYHFQHYFE